MKDPETNEVSGREVTRTITPGTVTDPDMLDETKNRYIVAILEKEKKLSLCFADISTGDVFFSDNYPSNDPSILGELSRFNPDEVYTSSSCTKNDYVNSYIRNSTHWTLTVIADSEIDAVEEDFIETVKNNPSAQVRAQRMEAFEKRIGLTEAQKVKAKEIRLKGHEKLKPVMDEIIAKKQEAKMVKMSRIAVQVQEERLAKIDAELKVLEKKAHDIKRANMKDFESILTWSQKRTLKQMKKEGRKKYQATHPHQRPMLAPQCLKKG